MTEEFTATLNRLVSAKFGDGYGRVAALHRAVTGEGIDVSAQAVSNWLAGKSPPSPDKVAGIERALDAGGELGPLLGLASDDPVSQRVAALEDRLATVEEQLRLLVQRRRGRRGT